MGSGRHPTQNRPNPPLERTAAAIYFARSRACAAAAAQRHYVIWRWGAIPYALDVRDQRRRNDHWLDRLVRQLLRPFISGTARATAVASMVCCLRSLHGG